MGAGTLSRRRNARQRTFDSARQDRARASSTAHRNRPTYRVHAYDAAGKEILTREFTVTTVDRPYNGVMPEYEKVQVDTGWVRMESGSTAVLDQRIATDIEEFWDHYQKETLPKVFRTVMASVSRRAAAGVRASLRHAQDRFPFERAQLRAGHRQGAHLLARSAAGRHVLLDRELRQHDGRSGGRPRHHLRRPHHSHRPRLRRRQRRARSHRVLRQARRQSHVSSSRGPTRRASVIRTQARSCGSCKARCSRG